MRITMARLAGIGVLAAGAAVAAASPASAATTAAHVTATYEDGRILRRHGLVAGRCPGVLWSLKT